MSRVDTTHRARGGLVENGVMKARFVGLLAGLAALAAGPAGAQDPGFFAFADVGKADAERFVGEVDVIDGDDFSWDLGVGYSFSRFVALQFAYHDFGDVEAIAGCPPDLLCIADDGTPIQASSPDTVKVEGLSLAIVGNYPLPNLPIGLFAKIGAIDWDSDWEGNTFLDESGTDLILGAGVSWAPSERVTLKLAYEEADIEIKSVTLGAAFRF